MKRIGIFVFSALLLLGTLCGCSASGRIDDPFYPDGYSNVSTTRDGTVNGVNDRRVPPPDFDTDTTGARRRTPQYSGSTSGTVGTGARQSGVYTGTTSGTGMVGGK